MWGTERPNQPEESRKPPCRRGPYAETQKMAWDLARWKEGIIFQVAGTACAKIWRLVG